MLSGFRVGVLMANMDSPGEMQNDQPLFVQFLNWWSHTRTSQLLSAEKTLNGELPFASTLTLLAQSRPSQVPVGLPLMQRSNWLFWLPVSAVSWHGGSIATEVAEAVPTTPNSPIAATAATIINRLILFMELSFLSSAERFAVVPVCTALPGMSSLRRLMDGEQED